MFSNGAVPWNAAIAVLAKLGLHSKALRLYLGMLSRGLTETPRTFPSLMAACSPSSAPQLHARAFLLGFLPNPFVSSSLVSLYSLSSPNLALSLFRHLPSPPTPAFNSLLSALPSPQNLSFFAEFSPNPRIPNWVSLSFALRSCSHGGFLPEGRQTHCFALKLGFFPSLFVSNALVDFYSNCGLREDAASAFASIPAVEIISWNSIVAITAVDGLIADAVGLFNAMISSGKKPSVRSLVSLLRSCGRNRGNFKLGASFHGVAVKLGFDLSDVFVVSALIKFYGSFGHGGSSVSLWENFEGEKSLEGWNSLITSLVQCGHMDDARKVFEEMSSRGITPDSITLSSVLRAVSSSSWPSLAGVSLIHGLAEKLGLAAEAAVAGSMMCAYSRSGGGAVVPRVFEHVKDPGLVCCTAAVTALGRAGDGGGAVEQMEGMMERGIMPDGVSFVAAMAGCDHAGMVEEGRKMMERMEEVGLVPDRRHYCAMVSLLGRAGMVGEAAEMAARAPPDMASWMAVLRSSVVHGEEAVGKVAAKAISDLGAWSLMKKDVGLSSVEIKEKPWSCL
ncbi:pentatricopeptide repeat-containing protein At3g09040, mitochondrial-like [Wolffia australiana]